MGVLTIKQTNWIIRLYLPFIVFYLLCALIFASFIYLMNVLNIGQSLHSTLDYLFTWGSLVLVYLVFGIAYLYWYVRKIIVPMHPNDGKQQRKTLHIAGWGLYGTWLVCLIGFLVSLNIDNMTFVVFLIGLLGTTIGSILYLVLGPRWLKTAGNQHQESDQTKSPSAVSKE